MRQYPSSLRHQSGIALIAVLLFLILIMVVGAIAVRQSSVDLNVAASDQANALLINSADSVLAHIEVSASGNDSKSYNKIMSQDGGVLGHFIVNPESKIGDQVSFCYRSASDNVFNMDRALVRKLGSSADGTSRACNPNDKADYGSERSTAMTQVVVVGLEDQLSDDFNLATRGMSDAGGQDGKVIPKVQINGVSVLPAMSNKSSSDIQACLGKPVGDAKEYNMTQNINDCLRQNNIPSNIVVEEGAVQYRERKDAKSKDADGKEQSSPCEKNDLCKTGIANPPQ